ncbi:S1C family serine protease [Leucobacter sp. NPDC058333]|uniref:S1C family serine protease n=1 Tax=Leucobacter sp. NPDC058333 TaxID=3346450 RepID=UPI003662AE19
MSTTPEYDQDGRLITPSSATPEAAAESPAASAAPAAPPVQHTQPTVQLPDAVQPQIPPVAPPVTPPTPTQQLQHQQQESYGVPAVPAYAPYAGDQAQTQHTAPTTPLDGVHVGAEAGTAFGLGAHHPGAHDPGAHTAGAQAPGSHATGGYAGAGAPGGPVVPVAPGGAGAESQPNAAKGRAGMLLAGLAIGALLGGAVGGGVAAVVSANSTNTGSASATGSSAITLNNADNATAISGVAAVATPSVVTLEVAGASASGSGSGVIYSEDGYIVTNAHVVTLDGAAMSDAKIRVKLSDGRIFDGSVVDVDPYADLAVVKVDATDLPAIKVADSDKIDVGDLTVAIGAPLNLANTVTSGVVSALNRGISVGSPLIEDQPSGDNGSGDSGSGDSGSGDSGSGDSGTSPWDFRFGLPDEQGQQQQPAASSGSVTLPVIQTDASINPGNSGGALLNGNGELIGINVAIASTSTTGDTAGSVGLGFAIPSNLVSRVADAIIAGDQPSHGLLGASVADSSQDTDADANHAGGLLVDVSDGGAAVKAGLKAGDVITAVDGVAAVDGTSVSALIREHAGGSKVTIEYTRNGKAGETEATLGTLKW